MSETNSPLPILIYQGTDGQPNIDVKIEDESVWLSQQQLADLYQSSRTNVVEHIQNIYQDGELIEDATCRNFRQVRTEGTRQVSRDIPHYNLDLIISLGYRIKSKTATHFRQWATQKLREYIIKGFTIDDVRLKNGGGGQYWKELLATIKDIRSSEKVLYRQVLELYATATDYAPKSNQSKTFFATVQNKLHYAANGKTAAEIINERANADLPFMGLLTFSGNEVRRADIATAKNYLNETEIKRLNNIVSAYFDIAELRAIDEIPTTMNDYLLQLDKLMLSMDRKVLQNAGSISHVEAEAKALREYQKYKNQNLSDVETEYLKSINELSKKISKNAKSKE